MDTTVTNESNQPLLHERNFNKETDNARIDNTKSKYSHLHRPERDVTDDLNKNSQRKRAEQHHRDTTPNSSLTHLGDIDDHGTKLACHFQDEGPLEEEKAQSASCCSSEPCWSWVVMFASFFISVTVDGLHLSYGVFQLEFLDYFGSSKAHTSAVGSVQSAVYHLTG